jgi:hypothetical protein
MEGGAGLLVNIAADYENEFNKWYDKEHISQLLALPMRFIFPLELTRL